MAEKLGAYTLNRRIGVGGMADVFLADGPRGVCVIKRPHAHLRADSDFLRMFLDEASLLAQLHHPGIAEIYELGHVDDVFFLAMEYVRGFDLMTISLEHERQGELIAPELCARIVADAAAALHYAHDATGANGRPLNIIHRDVTPHNILLSTRGEVKLIDFGVARASSTLHRTQAGLVKGKYPYMSPEQITGQFIDRRVDVYALGLVLYELLTNVRAIAGQTEVEQIDNARLGRIRPIEQLRPNTPIPLRQIVASCLFNDVDSRYPTALAVKEDLDKYLAYERHVVGREDLLRLFRVVAAEMRIDLAPTLEDDASRARPTEQEQPVSAVVLPEHGVADELALGMGKTTPSMKNPMANLPSDAERQRATDLGGVPPVEPNLDTEARSKTPLNVVLPEAAQSPAEVVPVPMPARPRWPLIIGGVLVLAGVGLIAVRSGSNAATQADAGVDLQVDAGPSPFVFPEDAGVAEPELADAGELIASPFVDAGPSALAATVRVLCDPQAEVIIDKRSWGRTPVTAELGAGAHQVILKGPDRFRRVVPLKLEAGDSKTISIAAKKGSLKFEVTPFALIKLNGESLGTVSFKELEVYEGAYVVDLELSDPSIKKKVVRKLQVTVKAGEQAVVHETMFP